MEETEEPDFEGDYKTYDNGYGEYNENVQEDDEINEESEEEEIDEEDDGESGEDSYDDTEASDEQNDEYDNQDQQEAQQERPQAPAFKISSRIISAVEHPFQIMDLDKGLDTFGPTPQFESVSPKTTSPNRCERDANALSRSWTLETRNFLCPSTFTPTTPLHDL